MKKPTRIVGVSNAGKVDLGNKLDFVIWQVILKTNVAVLFR